MGVSCFCDNRMGGQTDPATGLVITAPETLDTNKEALIVLICVVERSIYTSIYGQLSDMGFVDEQIRDIIIFEPELCKKEAIEKNLGCHRFTLYQSGVWSQQDRLYFDALDTVASRVSETESGYVIPAVALDDMVYDRAPTYIKHGYRGFGAGGFEGQQKNY